MVNKQYVNEAIKARLKFDKTAFPILTGITVAFSRNFVGVVVRRVATVGQGLDVFTLGCTKPHPLRINGCLYGIDPPFPICP